MKQPTDKQIEETLAGIATQEEARYVARWFATAQGRSYLEMAMTRDSDRMSAHGADWYVNHPIPTNPMLAQIKKNIRAKKFRRIGFRVAAALIPIILFMGLYMQLNSRVDLFGYSEYEEIAVPRGERMQMVFQDGTKVYLNSDSKLKYPKKFSLSSRNVYLEGEAYFEVTPNKHRPFIVNLNGSVIRVLGTSFNVQDYPENRNIVVCLDEGNINMTLPTEKRYAVLPGEKLVYDKGSRKCVISKIGNGENPSVWKRNVIVFEDTPLPEAIKVLSRWYDATFKIDDVKALSYLYTLTSENTSLEKVLMDMEKISPVKFMYNEQKREVTVKMK